MVVLWIWATHVPSVITPQDRAALTQMLGPLALEMRGAALDYDQQIALIAQVQKAVIAASPEYRRIPPGQSREPADLLRIGHGYCFDRGRSIDKALRMLGFEARYAALYSRKGSLLETVLTRGGEGVRSHVAIEVLTQRGWLAVDTVNPWIALDESGAPLALKDLEDGLRAQALPDEEAAIYFLYKQPFYSFYGLYSRHGHAYPPYLPLPDVDWLGFVRGVVA